MKGIVLSLLVCGGAVSAWAETATPLATSDVYADVKLDTRTVRPIKTAEALSQTLSRAEGDEVTAQKPSGGSVTVNGTEWTASEGGVWTLVSRREGEAVWTVRYGLFGARGTGTAENPAKIVDHEELVNLVQDQTAASGYVFTLCGLPTLLDTLVVPTGYLLTPSGADCYEMREADPSGAVFVSSAVTAFFDTELPGPDRRAYVKESVPVAYSGDWWRLPTATGASTLTIIPPSGTAQTTSLTGTGTEPFTGETVGKWKLSLTVGSETVDAWVTLRGKGFQVFIR